MTTNMDWNVQSTMYFLQSNPFSTHKSKCKSRPFCCLIKACLWNFSIEETRWSRLGSLGGKMKCKQRIKFWKVQNIQSSVFTKTGELVKWSNSWRHWSLKVIWKSNKNNLWWLIYMSILNLKLETYLIFQIISFLL